MNDNQNLLQSYIQKILAIQEQKDSEISEEDLHKIAEDLGLTSQDFARLEKSFEGHWKRGVNFSKHNRFEDAIEELLIATAIKPLHPEPYYELAAAFQKKWTQTGKDEHRQQAEYYAKRCLHLEPEHKKTYLLLGEMEKKTVRIEIPMEKDKYEKLAFIVGGVFIIAFILAFLFF
jgi:tetratricopeptide (TPR) repeat protein